MEAPACACVDYTLYAVTDPVYCCEKYQRDLVSVVDEAIKGGASIIQYRDKETSDETYEYNAVKLLELVRKYDHVKLIINDRVDVALRIGADGVHCGQTDMPAVQARSRLPPGMLLGVSCNTLPMALKAVGDGADYLGVGAVFGSTTKLNARQDTGLETLKMITDNVRIPVVGIGGVNRTNCDQVLRNGGANGVAVISGLWDTEHVQKRACELRSILDETLARK